jgi:predicted RNA binding protein YcfA (HicA-like mRNA interferase family)
VQSGGYETAFGYLGAQLDRVSGLLEADGWYLVVTRGSHRQFKHPVKPGRLMIAGRPGDDMAAGTVNSILKQAQLKGGRK